MNRLLLIILILAFAFNCYLAHENNKMLWELKNARCDGKWLEFMPSYADRYGRANKQFIKLVNMIITNKVKK